MTLPLTVTTGDASHTTHHEEIHGLLRGAPWVNVQDYGAVGDGTTNDLSAIQLAIDGAPDGGTILFPPGTYGLSGSTTGLNFTNRSRLNIVGRGATLKRLTSGAIDQRWMTFSGCNDIRMTGLGFDANNISRYGGVNIGQTNRMWVWNCRAFDSNLNYDWLSYDHYWLVVQICEDIFVHDNLVENLEIVEFNRTERIHIHDNTSNLCASAGAIGYYNTASGYHAYDVYIHDNVIVDHRKSGIICRNESTGRNNADVRNFNIHHNTIRHQDRRVVTDGVTNGTTTVTSATAAFTANDVGHYITGTNIPASTRIQTITNATTVVLSASATGSGSGITFDIQTPGLRGIELGNYTGGSPSGNLYDNVHVDNNTFHIGVGIVRLHEEISWLFTQQLGAFENCSVKNNYVVDRSGIEGPYKIKCNALKNSEISGNVSHGGGYAFAVTQGENCIVRDNVSSGTVEGFLFASGVGGNKYFDNKATGSTTKWTLTSMHATDQFIEHLYATATWDPGSVIDGAMTSTTVTVTDAVAGSSVAVGFTTAVPAGCILSGAVTSANTVTVTLFNKSGSTQDLASGTLRVDVWKHTN